MEILTPYRNRIDELDAQIIDLLHARYQVIEEVAHVKAREGIASVLPDRIDEVLDKASERAVARGLDGELVRTLYTKLIEHSCAVEDRIMDALHGETQQG